MKYEIKSIVGVNCITSDDGDLVYNRIIDELKKPDTIELDFNGVAVFASPFFNSAVARLYKDYSPEMLNKYLNIINLSILGKEVLNRVIENAKKFYSDDKAQNTLSDIIRQKSENE